MAQAIELQPQRGAPQSSILTGGQFVEISIRDDGPGLPAELLDRVFDPGLVKNSRVGTGLGLSICWSIIDQAGGTIAVDSPPGGGCAFRILLPSSPGPAQSVTGAPAALQQRSARPAHVLVVDDEEAIRELILRQLESCGHTVRTASDGLEAAKILDQSQDFDLVISDVLMPGMGGIELAERLKEQGSHIPGLLVSGYSPEFTALIVPAQRWPVLTKPFTTDELLNAVEGILEPAPALRQL